MATIPTESQTASQEIVKNQRRYTVGYVPNRGDTSTPALNLSGKWLREAGFDTGIGVTVKIAGDCIVLIPDKDEVRELREQLRLVKLAVTAVA
ncbi:SymE family type I addiction module toxin [Kluyvera intermedia]|uniref:SymE family type I addiction module toxin n=1 Tax=Kluyvera intermedia TaxID=61648 RepID=UPI003B9DE5B9